jgi:aconitate hydratase
VGAQLLASACGPCIGQWRRAATDAPNTIVTSYNRNFPGRNDGRPQTMNLIASPEIVVALALAGRLSFDPLSHELTGADGRPFRLEPPSPAPDVPPAGFAGGSVELVTAPDRSIRLAIAPDSERLARLAAWPAWDGRDLLGMPVLLQARGKTTTDDISPAGAWLRYRGHLERFADNLLAGAVDAHTRLRGRAVDADTGLAGTPAEIARGYRARGVAWAIVGDANYGEGSSREHAALVPRLLGCRAVIARSFARIHASNLRKQGLLALVFVDPDDYERIGPGARLDLLDLGSLAPGRPVRCRIHGADGGVTEIALAHGATAAQLEWFRAGSALNLTVRARARAREQGREAAERA